MQLGMIGLGRMGANMVKRLLRSGHEIVAYRERAGGRQGRGGGWRQGSQYAGGSGQGPRRTACDLADGAGECRR